MLMRKRTISLFLALALVTGFFSASAAADTASSEQLYSPSEAIIEYIKQAEGFSAEAYCSGGAWYIGYGLAYEAGDYPDGISEEEAAELMAEALETCAESVSAFLTEYSAEVNQSQFDALCSMTYAFGSGWLDTENRLPSYLAAGIENYTDKQIVDAFAAWCHIDGEIDTSLLRRRIDEAKIFLYGDYGDGSSPDWCWLALDLGGGEAVSDVSCYEVGESYGELPTAERSGYSLSGWQTADGAVLSADDAASESLSVTAVWSEKSLYSDVETDAWYYTYISDLSAAGIVSGYDDGTFRPEASVSWGEALKLVLLASGHSEQTAEQGQTWSQGYLDYAVRSGYVDSNTEIDLNSAITRYEIASLTAKALDISLTADSPFADTSDADAVTLYAAGIMEGSSDSGVRTFNGETNITRAEISAVILRISEYLAENYVTYYSTYVHKVEGLAANGYDTSLYSTVGGRKYYGSNSLVGIDVSFHQGTISWPLVAADGIDYVMLRCGYRGYSSGDIYEDTMFAEYITGALSAGLPVGIYFFSQATSAAEAVEEAEFVLSLIEGYEITWPVVFDWEPQAYSTSRTLYYSGETLTDCAAAFCQRIAAAGYTPAVYYSEYLAYFQYDLTRLTAWDKWLAHYVDMTDYYYEYDMWQYTSTGSVNGINGNVDISVCHKDYR